MQPSQENNINDMPFVSVIMPVHNEEQFIERSIGALLEQTYLASKMEIIVADGRSTDNTLAIIDDIKKNSKTSIRVVDNSEGIAPTGLNRAIKAAAGEIIVRVDGHTIVDPNYVRECVAALMKTDACAVGGRMDAVSSGHVGNAISLAANSRFGIGNAKFHYSEKEEFVDTVYLGAWWKSVFEKHGLFNEELVRNQDDEFNYRLRARGCKILLCPRIRSRYHSRSTFRSLWRQYFQYGYWKVRVLQLHPRQMKLRQFVPLGFVSSLIFLAILSIVSSYGRWSLGLLIGTYLFANFAATILLARINVRIVPLLSLSFVVMHVSYGLGFIVGLITFQKYWRRRKPNDLSFSKTSI